MKRKIRYTEAPPDAEAAIGRGENVTAWFNAKFGLPTPEQLAPREETVKVTLALEKESVAFFKKQAKKQKVPYQRMIKNLLSWYERNWEKADLALTGKGVKTRH